MKLFIFVTIFSMLSVINKTYSQEIKFGISGEVLINFSEKNIKYNFTQGGEIDKTSTNTYENDFGNFNSFGVSSTIIFTNNFVFGLKINYGEKNIWDISFGDNYDTQTNISVLSLSVPFYYHYKLDDDYFLEAGVNVGYSKGNYCENYNLRNPNSGNYEDKKEEKIEYTILVTPQISFGTKLIYPFEPEIFVSYNLTSTFEFTDFRFDYLKSIEYNFNGLSVGLTLKYIFNL